jgi:hypothetical protein
MTCQVRDLGLDELEKFLQARIPEHVRPLRYTSPHFQRRLGRMRADIVAGAVFPDYELIDHTGKRR